MTQTGIPFGDKITVKNYLKLDLKLDKSKFPKKIKKEILGFETPKVEKSGKILWTVIKELYFKKENFFENNFILNFYPLCFLDEKGRNFTPKKLRKTELESLYFLCKNTVEELFSLIKLKRIIAIGNETYDCLKPIVKDKTLLKIIHPAAYKPQSFIRKEYLNFFNEIA